MWPNPQFPADMVTFTEEILNGKLHFLCSDLLTNYITVLAIQTKEWPYLTKSKSINCDILEFSDAVVTKILQYGDNNLAFSFKFDNWLRHIYQNILWLHFNQRIRNKKHYLAFLLAFLFFYFWKNLVYLAYLF